MFDQFLGRAVRRRRNSIAWQVGFSTLISLAFWAYPTIGRLVFPEPPAVRPPPLNPATERVLADLAWPEPYDECTCCEIEPVEISLHVRTPGPSIAALEGTETGRGSRRSGVVRIHYCVNESGTVAHAEVESPFPADPEIGEIVLRAVRTWRVDPNLVDATEPCSSIDFAIEFK